MRRPGFAHCSGSIKPQDGTASMSSMWNFGGFGKILENATNQREQKIWVLWLALWLGRRVNS